MNNFILSALSILQLLVNIQTIASQLQKDEGAGVGQACVANSTRSNSNSTTCNIETFKICIDETCTCTTGFLADEQNRNCYVTHNLQCDNSGRQCHPQKQLKCNETTNLCDCNNSTEQTYHPAYGSCVSKVGYTCEQNPNEWKMNCVDDAECKKEGNGFACRCKEAYAEAKNRTCIKSKNNAKLSLANVKLIALLYFTVTLISNYH